MYNFNCSLLGKKKKSDSKLFDTEIQKPFSTKFKSNVSHSSFIYGQSNKDNDEYSLSQDYGKILYSPIFRNDDSIDNSFLSDQIDDYSLFNKDFESENIISKQSEVPINNSPREKNEKNPIVELTECTNNLTKINKFKTIDILSKRGRRRNEEKIDGIEAKHSKNSQDNKLRKVKVIAFETVIQAINLHIINKRKKLRKLEHGLVRELDVEFNRKLLKTQIKDIFSKGIPSRCEINPYHNREIIEEIYKKREINAEVIKILEKTFEECFQVFIDEKNESQLKIIFNYIIREKLEKETREYRKDIMEIIKNFAKIFFEDKKPRNTLRKLYKKYNY